MAAGYKIDLKYRVEERGCKGVFVGTTGLDYCDDCCCGRCRYRRSGCPWNGVALAVQRLASSDSEESIEALVVVDTIVPERDRPPDDVPTLVSS